MNNKGRISITFLIGLLLFIAVIIGILEINGVINIRALFGGEGTFIPVDYEKEVVKLCNSMDDEGMYNLADFEKIAKNIEEFGKEYVEDDGENRWNELVDKGWSIFKGSRYCYEKVCYIYDYKDGRYRFKYDCEKEKSEKLNFDAVMNEQRANTLLATSCLVLDKKGEFENADYGVACKNYYCNVSIKGKVYSKNCREKVDTKKKEETKEK